MAKTESQAPTHEPPSLLDGGAEGAPSAPIELLESRGLLASREAAPALFPPDEVALSSVEQGVAAWHNGKKITALWSNRSDRNSWVAVSGMGWKKLATKNDSSLVSLTMLAAHAEQTNANVNLRIEADGRVHEIYVW